VKPRLWWRLQYVRDARNMGLPRKAVGNKWNPWERPWGRGCPILSWHHMVQMADVELLNLMFALLGFSLVLVPFILSMSLFLPLGMGISILCPCVLEVCNFSFWFYRGSELKVYLESQERLWT
jgi:hypothetical protein